jgi:DNA gyrase/topoisomerase IV subunit A
LKKSKLGIGSFETRQEDKIHFENAYVVALSSLNLENINIKAMLKDLTQEQLETIIKQMTTTSQKSFQHRVKNLVNFMKEIKVLDMVEDKINHAQRKLKEVLEESFLVQYSKPDGRINIDKFINDVESQLEKLNHNTSNMNES